MPSGAATIAVGKRICGASRASVIDQPSATTGSAREGDLTARGFSGSADRRYKVMTTTTQAMWHFMCQSF